MLTRLCYAAVLHTVACYFPLVGYKVNTGLERKSLRPTLLKAAKPAPLFLTVHTITRALPLVLEKELNEPLKRLCGIYIFHLTEMKWSDLIHNQDVW